MNKIIRRILLPITMTITSLAGNAHAELDVLSVTSSTPIGTYRGVPYIRMEGWFAGHLDPASERIPDLDKVARDASGRVAYKTRFFLIAPKDPQKSNGALLMDIPNRGLPISHAFYNSPRTRPLEIGSLDPGIGFLEEQGFMIAIAQWELGQGMEPPSFTDSEGKVRYVEATGFAATRDLALFLRDRQGVQNPLSGAVKRTVSAGYSQTSRFLKSFLLNGFNTVDGRQVINGFHLVGGAAGQLPLMASGVGPASVASSTPAPSNPEHRGVHEEPFTYGDVLAAMQARREPLPKIFVTHFTTDYLGGRASLTRTGAQGSAEQGLAPEIRMYDIAGAAHLNLRKKSPDCAALPGQLDWSPPLRAQLHALNRWLADGAEPPASAQMPLRKPLAGEGVFAQPNYLPNAVVLVPQTTADGNPVGGIQLPDVAAPLGTHGRQNSPLTNPVCRLAGSYKAFAATRAERESHGDARLSLEERYPGGLVQYVTAVREASDQLVSARYLLPSDAAVIVNAAADEPLFAPTPTLPIFRSKGNLYNCPFDTNLGQWQCMGVPK